MYGWEYFHPYLITKDMNEAKPVLWNRNFIQCCISYFLMNFSFYMLMPTMPVYLVEVLKINPSEVGIALSSYSIGLLCVRPFSGYLVDCFPVNHYICLPLWFLPVCLPVICLQRRC